MTAPYRGRFAPSPTGPLHVGSLVAAVGSWLMARHHNGQWLLRIEDIDPPREMAGAAELHIETLAACGLRPDQPVLWQSTRNQAYSQAIDTLLHSGLAFECRCSRSDLSADVGVHRECVESHANRTPAIRLRVAEQRVAFDDAIQGHVEQSTHECIGDFVLRRADGLWAYQLAVVVDDAAQHVSHVVRGADLIDSTLRQILLQRALGLPTPRYAHLPMAVDASGRKMGKSTGARAIDWDNPLPALRIVLKFLGQWSDSLSGAPDPDTLLMRALEQFDPATIPRVLQRIAANPCVEGRIGSSPTTGENT